MPEISVLIPVYNAEATLDEALESVRAQTLQDWEALVVDDGSTDATPRLLQAWERRDSRFRILRNERNVGIVPSLNRAIAASRAPLLARMDADDVALPSRFAKQVERITVGDVAAVGCFIRYFPDAAVGDGAQRYAAWLNSLVTPDEHDRDLFVECPLAHPTMLLRADAVREAGGYQDHGWPEDYDLLLRLWGAGGRMAKVPEVLLHWRENPARTSRTRPEYSLPQFPRCKARYLRQSVLREQSALIFGAGPTGKDLARALLAEGAPVHAFVDVDPRKIGRRIYNLPILSREEGLALRERHFGLAAMGRPENRELLRRFLRENGWREPEDFRCVS